MGLNGNLYIFCQIFVLSAFLNEFRSGSGPVRKKIRKTGKKSGFAGLRIRRISRSEIRIRVRIRRISKNGLRLIPSPEHQNF